MYGKNIEFAHAEYSVIFQGADKDKNVLDPLGSTGECKYCFLV